MTHGRRTLLAGALATPLIWLGERTGLSAETGTVYYVSPAGNDEWPGDRKRPWRTLARANAAQLVPGDQVLLAAGGRFEDEPLRGRHGVTYGAFGSGPMPVISPVTGPGLIIKDGAGNVVVDGLDFANIQEAGAWIDRAGSGIDIVSCRFRDNVLNRSRARNFQAFHTPDLTLRHCVFERSYGDDHVYLYNCDRCRLLRNRIRWEGPQNGDCLHIDASADATVVDNTFDYRAGGKGCIMIGPAHTMKRGGLIEGNTIRGGQYGIAARMPGCTITRNLIVGVGSQPDAQKWASGIWLATSDNALNASGIRISECAIQACRHAIYGWDAPDGWVTEVQFKNCLVQDCPKAWFGHDRGILFAKVERMLVINCGPRLLPDPRAHVVFHDNYFHSTDGEVKSPPPRLGDDLCTIPGNPGYGYGLSQPLSDRN